jgi:flagellar biosynthetic protein FlhB
VAESDQNDAEKSEDPTQKRLDEALQRGDVAKSQEVSTWFVMAAGTLALAAFANPMGHGLTTTFRGIVANAHQIPVDGRGLVTISTRMLFEVLGAVAAPLALLVLAAIVGNMVQHRLVWSSEALKPQLSKISPLAGLKRMFSKQSLMNFVKGLIKLAVVGTVMFLLLWPERTQLDGMVRTDIVGLLAITRSLSLEMMGAVVAILALIAGADYFFQYRQWFERQKMSLREIKDEFKQTEGDPMIKNKIRQLRMFRMKKRMMTQVPKASVIIANPTHYAVALQYERDMNAPVCVAKGVDLVALKIREIGEENSVPIVENPPLARALYATVEIDEEIPEEHYKAVAEIIGYVMKLRRGGQPQ